MNQTKILCRYLYVNFCQTLINTTFRYILLHLSGFVKRKTTTKNLRKIVNTFKILRNFRNAKFFTVFFQFSIDICLFLRYNGLS